MVFWFFWKASGSRLRGGQIEGGKAKVRLIKREKGDIEVETCARPSSSKSPWFPTAEPGQNTRREVLRTSSD